MAQVSVLAGVIWGFVGSIAMVIVMGTRGDEDPPSFAVYWSETIGDGNPSDAMPQALLLHVIYAMAAGGAYVVLFSTVDLGLRITGYVGGVVWGVFWAVILLAIGFLFWVNMVLDMDPDQPAMVTMGLAHLAYGLTLGLLSAAVPTVTP